MPMFLQDNKMLAWILAALAFLVAFVLILKIFEIIVDLRRRMPRGSRSRQQRLGFVETFDLDGERQLLLLRRDNVEHLMLIGGPNDVLVESGIVRAESRESRAHRPAVEGSGLVLPPALVAAAASVHAAAEPDMAESAQHMPAPPLPTPPLPMPPLPAPAFEPLPPAPAPAPSARQRGFRPEPPVFAPPPEPAPEPFAPFQEPPPREEAPQPVEASAPVAPPAPQPVEPPPAPAPVADRVSPRFPPLPPRVFQARPTPRQLPPLPPRADAPRETPAGDAAKGLRPEATPRPRFVMPPIARRATPVANPPRPAQPDLAAPAGESPPPPRENVTPEPVAPAFKPEPAPQEAPAASERSFAESLAPQEAKQEAQQEAPKQEAPKQEAPKSDAPAERSFDADFEPLESLEEEMAKLLGRPISKN